MVNEESLISRIEVFIKLQKGEKYHKKFNKANFHLTFVQGEDLNKIKDMIYY